MSTLKRYSGTNWEYVGGGIVSGNTQKARYNYSFVPSSNIQATSFYALFTTELITTGGDLFVTASALSLITSAGNSYIAIQIDGTFYTICTTNVTSGVSGTSGSRIISNINSGTHTIKFGISPNSGFTATLKSYNTVSCSIIEL